MTHLQEGDLAPNFEGINEQEESMQLSDFKDKKLILFFYPKDDTPGCTAAACNLRDNSDDLKKLGFEMLGVSPDPAKKHQKFIQKYDFPFHLLADTEHKIMDDYGVWGPKKFMGREYDGVHRTTFIIGGNGKIEKVFRKVKTKNHTAQILEALAS